MIYPKRPTNAQVIPAKYVLLFFIVLSAVLAIATGYFHQRWQNQLKRTLKLQTQLESKQQKTTPNLKVDPSTTSK